MLQTCMIVIACVFSNVPNKSSKLDFKLWFLPHILTDAIQTALTQSSFYTVSSDLGPKGHKYQRQKMQG